MKLLRLKLENFRQHRDTTVEFAAGMTAIVGPNGAGKSTILEAITFALYGQQRKTKETIKFYWAEARTKFRVTLSFEFDGRRYSVERSGTEASLSEVTESIAVRATGLREVTGACERLLSLTYEQFTNSFCAEQKELAFLNFKNNAARQDEVARMLGFDRLKGAATIGKERSKLMRIQVDTLERSMLDLEVLQQKKREAEMQAKQFAEMLKEDQRRLKETEAEMGSALARKLKADEWTKCSEELNEIRARSEGLKEAVKHCTEAVEAAKAELAELEKVRPMQKEYLAAEKRLVELESLREKDRQRDMWAEEMRLWEEQHSTLQDQLEKLPKINLKAAEETVAQAQATLDEALKSLKLKEKQWQDALSSTRAALAAASSKADVTLENLKRAEEIVARGECPECGQPTSGAYSAIVENRRKEWQQLQKEVQKLENKSRELLKKPQDLDKAELEHQAAKERVDQAQTQRAYATEIQSRAQVLAEKQAELVKWIAERREVLAKMPKLFDQELYISSQKRLEELKSSHRQFMRLENAPLKLAAATEKAKEAQANLDSAKLRYKELESTRAQLGFKDAQEAQDALTKYLTLVERKTNLESSVKDKKQAEAMSQQNLAQAKKLIEDHKAKADELKALKDDLSLHELAAKELLNLREYLNKTIRPDLEMRASENLSLLTNGRYPTLELNDEFEPTLVEEDVMKHVISGGEEDVVALALRLALSELIQERQGRPMSLLVLDEVFGSLDVDRRQAVLDRLSAIKGRFDQILVISHIEEINQVADQCLYLSRDPATKATLVSDAPPMEQDLLLTAAL